MKQISILLACICFLFACNKESVDPNSELSLLKSQTWVFEKMEKYNPETKQYEEDDTKVDMTAKFSDNTVTFLSGGDKTIVSYEYEPEIIRIKPEINKTLTSYIKEISREKLVLEGDFLPVYWDGYRYTYIAQK